VRDRGRERGDKALGRRGRSPSPFLLRSSFHGDKGDLLDCMIRAMDMVFPFPMEFRAHYHVHFGAKMSSMASGYEWREGDDAGAVQH